jgi:hypothetical protein
MAPPRLSAMAQSGLAQELSTEPGPQHAARYSASPRATSPAGGHLLKSLVSLCLRSGIKLARVCLCFPEGRPLVLSTCMGPKGHCMGLRPAVTDASGQPGECFLQNLHVAGRHSPLLEDTHIVEEPRRAVAAAGLQVLVAVQHCPQCTEHGNPGSFPEKA